MEKTYKVVIFWKNPQLNTVELKAVKSVDKSENELVIRADGVATYIERDHVLVLQLIDEKTDAPVDEEPVAANA